MFGLRPTAATLAALFLAGTAASAHAQEAKSAPAAKAPAVNLTSRDVSAPDRNQWGLSARKSLQWDASKGRWGVQLDMDQPSRRGMAWQDVQAGAYFKVTPSLRVGGAVALGDNEQASPKALPREPAPRVRLETAFKF